MLTEPPAFRDLRLADVAVLVAQFLQVLADDRVDVRLVGEQMLVANDLLAEAGCIP